MSDDARPVYVAERFHSAVKLAEWLNDRYAEGYVLADMVDTTNGGVWAVMGPSQLPQAVLG